MSTNNRDQNRLVVGGPPRADLLPPEVKAGLKARSQRRGMIAIVIVTLLVVFAGYAGATSLAAIAQADLVAANNYTAELIAEQGSYAEVNEVLGQVALGNAAQLAATSTEINWKTTLTNISSRFPAGVGVENITVKAANPMTPFSQATVPLQPSRLASITFLLSSQTILQAADVIDLFPTTEGFASVRFQSTLLETGVYNSTLVLHVNEQALANRFVVVEDEEETE